MARPNPVVSGTGGSSHLIRTVVDIPQGAGGRGTADTAPALAEPTGGLDMANGNEGPSQATLRLIRRAEQEGLRARQAVERFERLMGPVKAAFDREVVGDDERYNAAIVEAGLSGVLDLAGEIVDVAEAIQADRAA